MLKPLTLNPVTYLSIAINVVLIFTYLIMKDRNQVFDGFEGSQKYNTIAELLDDVVKYQNSREYMKVIHILKYADMDFLTASEVNKPMPTVLAIDGFFRVVHGISDDNDLGKKYKVIAFPETSDAISDPGYDFWILWAERFTFGYNSNLEAALKRKP